MSSSNTYYEKNLKKTKKIFFYKFIESMATTDVTYILCTVCLSFHITMLLWTCYRCLTYTIQQYKSRNCYTDRQLRRIYIYL